MDYADIRTKIRAVILTSVGVIVALLFLRVALDLISASENNILVGLINSITDFFSSPFKNVIEIPEDTGIDNLNVDALVAALVYVLGGIALSEIVTAFVYEKFEDIFQNFVDGLFKILEFLILLRIVFYFFDIGLNRSIAPSFIKLVYDLTEWTQSTGLGITFLDEYLDWNAIIILIIIVVLDLLAERFLDSIFKRIETTYTKIKPQAKPRPAAPVASVQAPIPQPQQIIVNVPMPQVQQVPVQVPQPAPQQPQPLNVNITNPIPVQYNPQPVQQQAPQYGVPSQNIRVDQNGVKEVTGPSAG